MGTALGKSKHLLIVCAQVAGALVPQCWVGIHTPGCKPIEEERELLIPGVFRPKEEKMKCKECRARSKEGL